ncbi:MAG: ATP12 family protein [Bauldia sp.]
MTDQPPDPMEAARRLARREPPRRFYKEATAARGEGGFALLLDGRVARTPGRRPVLIAREAVARALAAEWDAQGEVLDSAAMPLTRLVNAAIDRVEREMAAVRAEIVAYALSDLVCYRAEGPLTLIEAQNAAWSPLIDWAGEALGARLVVARGVVAVIQDESVAPAVERAVAPLDALALAALHTATTLTGSAIIALALGAGRIAAEAAWLAAHVDENWQMSQWGGDEAALAQRQIRWREMEAAALILGTAGSGSL